MQQPPRQAAAASPASGCDDEPYACRRWLCRRRNSQRARAIFSEAPKSRARTLIETVRGISAARDSRSASRSSPSITRALRLADPPPMPPRVDHAVEMILRASGQNPGPIRMRFGVNIGGVNDLRPGAGRNVRGGQGPPGTISRRRAGVGDERLRCSRRSSWTRLDGVRSAASAARRREIPEEPP